MSSISQQKRKSPEFSVMNEKNQLKKLTENVSSMKNRVDLLKLQLQKEKDSIKKNKQMTKDAIQKKIDVNRINQYKMKDSAEEQRKLEELKQRNQSMRVAHHKQLEDIQKAIYLVKLDDAREVKNISMEHKKRLQEMDRQFLSAQKEKKRKIAQQSEKAKQRYAKYWKEKLTSLYTEQAQTIAEVSETKEKKNKELKELEEQQIRIMQEINQYHSKEVQSKKQYLAALSLPVKDVAEAMGDFEPKIKRQSSDRYGKTNESRLDFSQSQIKTIDRGGLRLPNTNLNQAKLKVILKQLKKMDRGKQTFSARGN